MEAEKYTSLPHLHRLRRTRRTAGRLRHRQVPPAHRTRPGRMRTGPPRSLHDLRPAGQRTHRGRRRTRLSWVVGGYGRLDLLLLDELGYVQIDPRGADMLFQIITEREERASIGIGINLSFSERGAVWHGCTKPCRRKQGGFAPICSRYDLRRLIPSPGRAVEASMARRLIADRHRRRQLPKCGAPVAGQLPSGVGYDVPTWDMDRADSIKARLSETSGDCDVAFDLVSSWLRSTDGESSLGLADHRGQCADYLRSEAGRLGKVLSFDVQPECRGPAVEMVRFAPQELVEVRN